MIPAIMYSAPALTAVTAEGIVLSRDRCGRTTCGGRLLGNNFGYEWTGTTYQETQAGTSINLILYWLGLSSGWYYLPI